MSARQRLPSLASLASPPSGSMITQNDVAAAANAAGHAPGENVNNTVTAKQVTAPHRTACLADPESAPPARTARVISDHHRQDAEARQRTDAIPQRINQERPHAAG
jgi:hypothetical protein